MHASIEQLLSLRDAGETGTATAQAAAAHVAGCGRCQAELERLAARRQALRALLQLVPPTDPWLQIAERAADTPPPRARRWWPAGLAASVLTALTAVMWLQAPQDDPGGVPNVSRTEQPVALPRDDVAALVAESRRLEQLLRSVPYEPSVVNARTAGTITQLEDQLALVDYGLSFGDARALSRDQASALWRQRVDLMNSLVHVRYAQAQRVDF